MRKVSELFKERLVSDNFNYFVMIKLWGLPYRTTSLGYEFTFDGELYTANNNIKALEPPKNSSVIDREAYKITLTDVSLVFKDYFETGAVNDRVTVKIGIFDIETGLPKVEPEHFLTVFEGKIDTTIIDVDFNEGFFDATIESSSPLASLDQRNAFYTSKRSLRQRFPTDSSFDFIHLGSGESVLKWGKE